MDESIDLKEVLRLHELWINDDKDGRRANLSGADLRCADLRDADLGRATFDDRIFCLDRIGSFKRRTTYNATKDIVWCGCFKGTFEEWVAKIRETYPNKNAIYRKEYEAAIAFFKTVAAANEEKAQNG